MAIFFSGPGPVPDLGSMPTLPPLEGHLFDLVPAIALALLAFAMLLSALYHFSERFREFWDSHVCSFMEKHGQKESL